MPSTYAHRRFDLFNLAVLAGLWIAMIALLRPVGDFPLIDDWSYARSVQALLDSGQFQLLNYSVPMGFPQAYWGSLLSVLFGFSFSTLRCSTLILGLGGVLGTYGLLREVARDPRLALLGAAAVAVNPLYFDLANTFMTDVPFYCFAVTSVFMIARGLRRDQAGWLLGGFLLSYLATLSRLFGIVIPCGYALAYLWSRPRTIRTVIVAFVPAAIGLALHMLLQSWLAAHGRVPELTVPQALRNSQHMFLRHLISRASVILIYTGLFTLPVGFASLVGDARQRAVSVAHRFWWAVGGLTATLFLVLAQAGRRMPYAANYAGNLLNYFGLGPLTLRDTSILRINDPPWSPWLRLCWWMVTALAALGAALLLHRCASAGLTALRRIRNEGSRAFNALSVFLVGTAAGYGLLVTTVAHAFYDRYILFCLPFAMLLVWEPWTTRAGPIARIAAPEYLPAWTLLAVSAAFSVIGMRDYLEWNRMRWTATADLMEQHGASPAVIDGGYEFNGWLNYRSDYVHHPGKSWWWVDDDLYLIASGPVRGYMQIASYPFDRWLTGTRSQVVVLQRNRAGTDQQQ